MRRQLRQVPDAPPEDAEDAGFDVRALAGDLWEHKWLGLGVAALIATGTVFWTLRQTKVYEAVCQIEYDPNPARPMGHELDDVGNPISNYWMAQDYFETQNKVIASRLVAEKVVRRLRLNHLADFMHVAPAERAGWEGSTVAHAAQELQRRLTVEPVQDTHLVLLKLRDRDPEMAATLANAVADAYVDKVMQDRLSSTVSAAEWLRTQLDSLRRELEQSELSLHEFKRDHHVLSVSLEDRQNIVASDIAHFNSALTDARTRRIELRARLAQLREANDADPMQVHATVVTSQPLVLRLKGRYREKLAERDALADRYGPAHPRMLAADRELESIRTELGDEISGIIDAAEADLAETQRVEVGLRGALGEANQAGLELNLQEIEYDRLNRARESNAKLYGMVLERSSETDLAKMMRVTNVRVLDRALNPTTPVSPRVVMNTALGVVGGLTVGLALALFVARMDRRIRSVEDAEGQGLPILGVVPLIEDEGSGVVRVRYGRKRKVPAAAGGGTRDLITHAHPMSSTAESVRAIRTNLAFASPDDPLRSFVVTSPSPREGKTTVAVNLAIAIAQSGKRVLLVDTDLRRPRIHRVFGKSAERGVTSVLVGEASLKDAVQDTEVPDLDLLPCGPIPPNPAELLHSARFQELLELGLKRYDRVIFDSPPLGAVTDAAVLAAQAAGVIVIIKAEHTTRDALRAALRQLQDVGANSMGVLNAVDLSSKRYGYGYGHYYRYRYYGGDGDGAPPATAEADPGERPRASA